MYILLCAIYTMVTFQFLYISFLSSHFRGTGLVFFYFYSFQELINCQYLAVSYLFHVSQVSIA